MIKDFLADSKRFFEDVEYLRTFTNTLEHLSSKLNYTILNEEDEKATHNQIETINKGFRNVSYALRERLSTLTTELDRVEDKKNNFEYRTKKIHLHAQTKAFTAAINEFRDVQLKHKNKEEEKFKLQYVIAKPGADQKEIDECISGDNREAKLASAYALASNSAKGILEEAEKRQNNIKKIGKMIQELIELMRILNDAISKQSDIVDKIAENLTTAEENTIAANVDLQQALNYQIMSSRIKRIIGIVVIVICIIFVGYLFLMFGRSSDTSSKET